MKQKLISVFLLLVGLVLLAGSFVKAARYRKIEVEGENGFANIADKSETTGKRGKVTYHFTMKPRSVSGPEQDFQVSREMFDSRHEGESVPIKYLANDIDDYILLGKEDDSGNAKLAGVLLTVIGAFGTWWFVFKQ